MGPPGGIFGVAAPLPPRLTRETMCLCFPDLSRSVFQLRLWPRVALSLPLSLPLSAGFHLPFSLRIYFRESEMGNIKMDEIPVVKVTADGKL